MPYATIRGQRIYYQDTAGAGGAVVFAHGFLMDHEMWRPHVEALRDEFRCISYDERGWGQTDTDGKPFDYWDLADDVAGLLDHLEISTAALVGFSQGGFLGLRLALRYPDRVSGLVLADTGPHAFSSDVISLYRALFDQALHTGIDDAMSDTFTGILFAPGFDADRWVAKWRARPVASVGAAEECLVTRDEIGDRMSEISCPVLVVHGELDVPFPMDDVDEWATRLRHLDKILRVPGAGHSAMIEKPDAIIPTLRAFLRTLI